MLKKYRMPNGRIYQFKDGEVPENAVPVEGKKRPEPSNKAVKPANKARKAVKKK